ncbi:C6 zinc finger domain protein [Penicillium lagena]|uniref:C6 zinc finger domain protein n=1 Tax=Penicillium lagena TaxID=94218 RepID=UPI002542461E|nr:C6 zinc finger domain protein [Penicillium lagena]KAJ5605730.1 C6 zinc finger domain protein [Penicillium lagena]
MATSVGFDAHSLLPVMSTTIAKRKRSRKACIPCHQRKRKCDTVYPCGMCTTYGYNCRYAGDNTTDTTGGGALIPPSAKRVITDGESRLRNRTPAARSSGSRSQMERSSREADGSSTKSPTVVAGVSPGIFDEQKFRHSGASAAMAFPHILGMALGSDGPPKVRSFAYNFGIRPEEASNAHCFLGNLISEEDLGFFSGVYFSILGPIGDVIDPRIYAQRCRDYYHSSGSNAVAFAAVAAGVAALGSFLSPNSHPRESGLVQYAKAILDDPASMRLHGIDHIVAWGMRVFYLRATTRPSNAWIASCTQMHLCEAIGLHEEENIKKMASIAGAAVLGHDVDRLRRIFWISWAGHNMLSYEYDRSPVHFRAVTCQSIIPVSGSVADQFVQLIQIIPSPNSPFQLEWQPPTPSEELFERLKVLGEFQTMHPFLVVTKADIAFCFYRRLYQLKIRIPDEVIKLVIDSGNAGVEAAEQQANQGRLFWNVIGSVFQYACILLAIDTPAASVHIDAAFKGLENLVKAADTGLTREALSMARHLLTLNMAKKRKELAQLEAVEASYQFFPAASESNTAVPDMDWELDWDQFFIEPYLSMLGPDIQL